MPNSALIAKLMVNTAEMKKTLRIGLVTTGILFSISFRSNMSGNTHLRDRSEKAGRTRDSSLPGLYVNRKGVLMHEGHPYHGIGVNYFNALTRDLGRVRDTSYKTGLQFLSHKGIPFIRFSAAGYWPADWKLYKTNKREYFSRFDAFVKTAEICKIGLIPDLFWHAATISDLVGEPIDQWGNPDSKTIAFMKNYVCEVVTRYRNSPAIWGWEFTNEMNLKVDLPGNYYPPVAVPRGTPPSRSDSDKLSTYDMRVALVIFGHTIRLYDSSRIIISGNANARPCAYHLYAARVDRSCKAASDSKAEYGQMLGIQNPDPVNTVSIHVYPNRLFFQFCTRVPATARDIIQEAMNTSIRIKKPLFLGEFGVGSNYGTEGQVRRQFQNFLVNIETLKVPLSALWVFDYPPQDKSINIMPGNNREHELDNIAALNHRFIQLDKR